MYVSISLATALVAEIRALNTPVVRLSMIDGGRDSKQLETTHPADEPDWLASHDPGRTEARMVYLDAESLASEIKDYSRRASSSGQQLWFVITGGALGVRDEEGRALMVIGKEAAARALDSLLSSVRKNLYVEEGLLGSEARALTVVPRPPQPDSASAVS